MMGSSSPARSSTIPSAVFMMVPHASTCAGLPFLSSQACVSCNHHRPLDEDKGRKKRLPICGSQMRRRQHSNSAFPQSLVVALEKARCTCRNLLVREDMAIALLMPSRIRMASMAAMYCWIKSLMSLLSCSIASLIRGFSGSASGTVPSNLHRMCRSLRTASRHWSLGQKFRTQMHNSTGCLQSFTGTFCSCEI